MMRAIAGASPMQTPAAQTPAPAASPKGEKAFAKLARSWAEGFSVSGTDHWDDSKPAVPGDTSKGDALRALALGPRAADVLRFVRDEGGLTQAIASVIEGGDKALARAIAVNMAQVGSILFPDLCDLLEHFDPYGDEND